MAFKIPARMRPGLILAGLILLSICPPSLHAAESASPIVTRFELLGTPALGHECKLMWAGVPQITPRLAELHIYLNRPDNTRSIPTILPLKLVKGQTAEKTFSFIINSPGHYRIIASARMGVDRGRFVEDDVVLLNVPPTGRVTMEREPVLSAAQFAARQPIPALPPVNLAATTQTTQTSQTLQVRGVFRYSDWIYGLTGFVATKPAPIRRATVSVLARQAGKADRLLGATRTDNSGRFQLSVLATSSSTTATTTTRPSLFARIATTGPEETVQDLGQTVYTARSAFFNVWRAGQLDMTTITLPLAQSGPWNIYDSILTGYDYAVQRGSKPPRVTARWASGNTDGTYYNAFYSLISINGALANPDEFDDDIILREYGHHLAAKLSTDKSDQDIHAWTDTVDPQQAWSEGWAHFFSSAVRNFRYEVDTKLSGASYLDLQAPAPALGVSGENNEGSVASFLWDIFDKNTGNPNRLSDGISNIWYVFTRYFTRARETTAKNFYDGWVALRRPRLTQVTDLAVKLNMGFVAPKVTTFAISGGTSVTVLSSRNVTLPNTAIGLPIEYQASEASNFKGALWQSYSTNPQYTLISAGNGLKRVYFKVRNLAKLESKPTSATATLYDPVDFSGAWKMEYKWQGKSSAKKATWYIHGDLSFRSCEDKFLSDQGSWDAAGTTFTLQYPQGTTYNGRIKSPTKITGTMRSFTGDEGTWTATLATAAVVPWNVNYSWDNITWGGFVFYLYNNGTFQYWENNAAHTSGTWSASGKTITLQFSKGPAYTGTYKTSTFIKGDIRDRDGAKGKWNATQNTIRGKGNT